MITIMEKKHLNILFLGGAKRVSIGRKIIEAGEKMGVEVKIYSYELSRLVPIAAIGEVIVGLKWSDAGLLEHLHSVVEEYRIDVLLPFVDAAVGVAGVYVGRYNDAWAPVVNPAMAEVLFDKLSSATAFEEEALDIPETYKGGRPAFPLIAKPRHGSASKGLIVINDIPEFRRIDKVKDEYILQRYYPERQEYTVDCYISGSGEALCVSPRERLEVVNGEVSKTVTVDCEDVREASLKAISRLKLRGAVTIQYLRDRSTGRLMLMEINPRLGGGVVCTVHAGGDIPRLILEEALGTSPARIDNIRPGTLICRYFEETVFNV